MKCGINQTNFVDTAAERVDIEKYANSQSVIDKYNLTGLSCWILAYKKQSIVNLKHIQLFDSCTEYRSGLAYIRHLSQSLITWFTFPEFI